MVSATISLSDRRALQNAIKGTKKKIKKEMGIAVWAASKKTKTSVSRIIRSELAVAAKSVNKVIKTKRSTDPDGMTTGTVTVSKTSRIPLRDFKARQTKKGVSYKTSKSKGRKFVPGAFQGPRPGAMKASWRGRVFKRVGESRLPIQQLWGPSAWGVYVKNKMKKPSRKEAKAELRKQIARRVRFIKLKKSGSI